jgi:hypothetical protein
MTSLEEAGLTEIKARPPSSFLSAPPGRYMYYLPKNNGHPPASPAKSTASSSKSRSSTKADLARPSSASRMTDYPLSRSSAVATEKELQQQLRKNSQARARLGLRH